MTDYQSKHTGQEIDDGIDDAITALQPADVVNNLTSTSTTAPLSAAQGKALEDGKLAPADIVNSLTSTSTTAPLGAGQGKILQDGKVPNARTITAGTGLTGGGDLSANRTVALDSASIASLALADTSLQPGDDASDIAYDNYASALTATDVQAAIDELSDADGIDYDNSTSGLTATDVQAAIDENAQDIQNISVDGLFAKATTRAVAWTKTGAGTAETATALTLEVNGGLVSVSSGTSITMPGSFTAGTDYAIWCAPDGTLEADASFTVAPTANGRLIGGFHYAPGGNAAAQAGGNTTAQINEYSFWDLKFRPSCNDPRGMTLVADHFWSDIYLLNTDPDTNGTSANDKTIANGSADYPIIPDAFGGDGTTTYGSFRWFEAQEILGAYGKRAPTYAEFMQLAYGTTEEQDRGNDPVTTGFATTNTGSNNTDEEFTSKWGVIQASGVYYVWSRDFIADGTGTGGWQDIAEGRGEVYTYSSSARAGFFGGTWSDTTRAGSRCSFWSNAPSVTFNVLSARGVCDHLILD